MPNFSEDVISFNKTLELKVDPTLSVEVMNPFEKEETRKLSESFYRKYYSDNNKRTLIFGINPGRMGAGMTGVPFTDPVFLEDPCGLHNDLPKKHELSARFIYHFIKEYGGVSKFYKKYFITAISPLGFVKEGKNINYYDIKSLEKSCERFIVECIEKQLSFNVRTDHCIVLGEGKNYKYLKALNEKKKYFDEIIPLAHPRYIMQYKRKYLDDYIKTYLKATLEH